MEMVNFITKFSELFESTDVKTFDESTQFKDLEEWSSLISLFVICMADEEYNVTLKQDDILVANTIGDIYHLILSKT